MSVYNCEKYLKDAVESIINQTYDNWEMIICDDASTDGTYQLAKQYKDRYPDKIVLIQNESNKKLAYSLNRCLEKAQGEYIARMDGDDISLPERFEKQVAYLQQNPDVDLVGCAMQRFNDEGTADILHAIEKPDKYSMRHGSPFMHATIMTYKRVYDQLHGYTVEERTNRAQDYDLWFRFFYEGFVGRNIDEPLYMVREDYNAVKRRSFKVRYNAFKTSRIGYKMLGFPKTWICKEAVSTFGKAIVPRFIVRLYRDYQKRLYTRNNETR